MPRWRMFLAYVSGSFGFGFMAMAGFLVPLRAQELGAPLAVIGLIVGANSVLSIVGSVPAGALCDRLGARQLYILSTVMCAIGVLLLALTENYWVMLLVELVFGFPRTTVWIATQAYVTSLGRPEERASVTSRLSFSSNAGALAAPLLAGASAELVGYQASFWVLVPVAAVYTLIGVMLPDVRSGGAASPRHPLPTRSSGFRVSSSEPAVRPETRNSSLETRRARGFGGYGPAADLLRLRGMQLVMVLTFVRIWLLVGWFTFFRVLLAQLGFSPLVIGSVEAVSNLVNMLSSLAGGPASRWLGKEVAVAAGLAISGVGVALSLPLAFVPAVYFASALVGVGNGVTLPLLLALIADAVPRDRLGIAMGMRTSANRAASTGAPAVLGLVMTAVGIPMGLTISTVLSWVVLGWVVWVHRRDVVVGSQAE